MSKKLINSEEEIPSFSKTPSRRQVLKGLVGVGAAAAVSTFAAPAIAIPKTLKIGFVTPQTGPLAVFAEPDAFVLDQLRAHIGNGLKVNGRVHPLEIIVKDSQSNSNRAATVAQELLLSDEVDIITATSTPDTTNPVSDQAELNGTPCVTNDTPWQPWYFSRGGTPTQGFEYTYHFFWGLEDIIATFTSMWGKLDTNKSIGAMWPNDSDGNAWGDPNLGFPPVLREKGFSVVDPGRYQNLTDDFSAQIAAFKAADVEIVTGVMIPPDFTTFWAQSAQQNFFPKVCTVAKASEFPQAIQALGPRGDGLSVEVWWSPEHPFSSSLMGFNSREFANTYEASTGNPWTMPLGFKHALFEVAIDSLKRTEDLGDPDSIRDALAATSYQSIVGPIDFSSGPVPNVSKTPLVGGQWDMKGDRPYLKIIDNLGQNIPETGEYRTIV